MLSGVYSSLLGEYARPSLDLSCRACTRMVTRLYFAGFFDAVPIEFLANIDAVSKEFGTKNFFEFEIAKSGW